MRTGWLVVAVAVVVTGCTADDPATQPEPSRTVPTTSPSTTPPTSAPTTPEETRPPRLRAGDVRTATAWTTVRHLAGDIGPRLATGPAFMRAARWVEQRFEASGYEVRRQGFGVPGGSSWGVPVGPGRSLNLIATKPGVDLSAPHLVVGAHLDTVAVAPGAEDNASGVGVLLALTEAVAERRTRLPVVFIAFGAEEPRGLGDDDHHYGSRHYVDQLTVPQRRAVRGMVAIDRVGVGAALPVCSASSAPDPLRAAVLAAARRVAVRTIACELNRASDHWSFVRNGLPGVRVGGTPYAEYHSAADVSSVVGPDQLERAARTVAAWLSGP